MTTMTTVNKQRLIDLAAWAGAEDVKRQLGLPSQWDQGTWLRRVDGLDCGTACCIAGKVALEDGGVPIGWDAEDNDVDGWGLAQDGEDVSQLRMPGGDAVFAADYAQQALGLTERQANVLFSPSNNLSDVVRTVKQLIDGAL